jgi:heat-inducible transcriptional repressor
MRAVDALTDRERKVLEAVVETYIRTAEPAGSQTIARRYPLGLSSASIRSIMSDLEAKGYLFHTHTSAGRMPTDLAYRLYVNDLMRPAPVSDLEREAIRRELDVTRSAIAEILKRAAQVLGVLTQELGVAAAPQFDQVVLERLDLVHIASDRLLLVFHLRSGAVRTIFVQIPTHVAPATVEQVAGFSMSALAG